MAHEGQKNLKVNMEAQPSHSERGAPITGTDGSQGGGGVRQLREISAVPSGEVWPNWTKI